MHRLLKIIVEVKTDPRQSVPELLEKLGISKSQYYKDRELLSEIGFEFDYSRSQQRFNITKDMTLPIENLTISEQLSLVLALRQLSASGDHILTYEGLTAARKIAAQLPPQLREHLFDDVIIEEGFNCDTQVMDKLQKAIIDNWRVAIHYQRPDQDSPTREVIDPYHLFFKRRALYVEGYSCTENGIRMYRLSRIRDVEFKEKGFAVRPGYNFGRRYRNAFSAFPGESSQHVKVRFSRKIRPYIEESMWHYTQKTTRQPDGSVIFEADVAEPREVLWWTFFWGAGAEILEPEWLRDMAKDTIRKMEERYEIKGVGK
jgi:predicted DNA-binding transcriptional regulator YafY